MARFCTRCGSQLQEDGSPCPYCAGPVSPAQPVQPGYPPVQPVNPAVKPAGALQYTSENDVTLTLGSFQLNTALLIKIIAAVLCVIFFLPLFNVSCAGTSLISFNGLDSTFGKDISSGFGDFGGSEKVSGNFLAIFLLLIPAALFIALQFKKNLAFLEGRMYQAAAALSVLGVIAFIVFRIGVSGKVASYMEDAGSVITAKFTFWYYLSILLYIVIGGISVMYLLDAKKKSAPAAEPPQMPPQGMGYQ
ncbi:MAG: zinc ribbon domain-containing protein [Oscillospiraceae bacterium]|nr:zinc ribbon domain-containing protein [Oscillospiraceae bacterium]